MGTTVFTSGLAFDALTYEEGRQWELLGGELIPVSSPTPEHHVILQRILLALLLHLTTYPEQERSSDSQAKVMAYLRYGTREIWQVFPKSESVVVYRGGLPGVVAVDEQLSTALLPGFSLDPKTLFRR